MKIKIEKEPFIKSWNLAEKSAGTSGSMNIFSTIRLRANEEVIDLQATDIKTSIICDAKGVTVIEPGEAIIPIKGVGDLFKKAGSQEFTLQIEDGRAVMISGKNRYRFSTYPVEEFPKLPSTSGGEVFCSVLVSELSCAIEMGTLCASVNDEYPQYLSSAYFSVEEGGLRVVSTDNKRLSIRNVEIVEGEDGRSLLLPMKGIKELQRILGMIDPEVVIRILYDDSQVYFTAEGLEFAIRRVESKFPVYSRILPTSFETVFTIDRTDLISALDRVDVVVRDYNRIAVLRLSRDESCTLSGRAPEFGEAVEDLVGEVDGSSVNIGVSTRFLYEAVKVLSEPKVTLSFNGSMGHIAVKAPGSDSFLCLVAPVEIALDEESEESSEFKTKGDAF